MQQYHRESGKWSLTDPNLYCDECVAIYFSQDKLFDSKPLILDLKALSQVSRPVAVKKIGWLTSRKKWEFTQLNSKFWRAKLWNALYWWRGELKRLEAIG